MLQSMNVPHTLIFWSLRQFKLFKERCQFIVGYSFLEIKNARTQDYNAIRVCTTVNDVYLFTYSGDKINDSCWGLSSARLQKKVSCCLTSLIRTDWISFASWTSPEWGNGKTVLRSWIFLVSLCVPFYVRLPLKIFDLSYLLLVILSSPN